MQTLRIENDIPVFCVAAESLPDGVMHAWHRLHKLLGDTEGRVFYGISYMNANGSIIYKAGVREAFAGEGETYGCETVVISKGSYMAETIIGFPKQLHRFAEIFQTMIKRPDRADDGLCVEWYQNEKDVICMLKQREKETT